MALFGPLDYAVYGGLLHGLSGDVYGFEPDTQYSTVGPQRPRLLPNDYLWPDDPDASGTGVAPTVANPPVANSIAPFPGTVVPQPAPLPSMQMLGTLTTRRTQLFGPLAGISI